MQLALLTTLLNSQCILKRGNMDIYGLPGGAKIVSKNSETYFFKKKLYYENAKIALSLKKLNILCTFTT